jgi:hypothetical protein
MYIKSVDLTVQDYSRLLRDQGAGKLMLSNLDFDTGRDTRAGEYGLADKTYSQLVDNLTNKASDPLSPTLRENVLQFYSDPNAPVATKKDKKAWKKLQDELAKLKSAEPGPKREGHPDSIQ